MNHWWENLFRSWTKRIPRQLRLGETLALGERQFVSIVEFGDTRFLIGRTSASLSLLAQLPPAKPGADLSQQTANNQS